MILDSSAVVAILLQEPGYERLVAKLEDAEVVATRSVVALPPAESLERKSAGPMGSRFAGLHLRGWLPVSRQTSPRRKPIRE